MNGRNIITSARECARRPVSLVVALLVAVVAAVVSFMLLLFPLIAGYYYAVRESGREEFFIDLPNVLRTLGLLWVGVRTYFLQSYVLGILGLLGPALLFVAPVLPLELYGKEAASLSLGLQVLYVPASFLFGGVLIFGYPELLVTGSAVQALRHGIVGAWHRPFFTTVMGFLILFPVTGFVFHLLMVFTYPLLVAYALTCSGRWA